MPKLNALLCILSMPFLLLLINSHHSKAQEDADSQSIEISGYLESYYIYDFGNPSNHNRPDFLYSFNRHNEINLNFGFIQAAYQDEHIRGKLALMTGTYANANLAHEPGVLRSIFEANAGVKLSKKKDLWIDAGVFASHIGFESAIGADCWTMTRSLLAENSPYYLSGAKVSYTSDNGKWFLSGLVVNGWQRIQRVPGNQLPGFGHQVTWKPNEKLSLNSSSFIGSDTPDDLRLMRYFHHFYAKFQINEQLGLILGFDIGAEQRSKGSSDYHNWYAPIMVARYQLSDKVAIAARGEYYSDEAGVIIATGTPNGFQTFGYSLNVDFKIRERVLWRIEGRGFNSQNDRIFSDSNRDAVDYNYFVGTSLSIAF